MDMHSSYSKGEEYMHDKILRTLRCLVADLCQAHNSGHPGGAMSMAAMGLALYKYGMHYSPSNPGYFNRDRLVLSNGHTCLWQYIFMHWTGFPNMTMDQLQTYRSPRVDSICPGHSQIQHDGHEVTTGPIGEGVAQAVGLAVAAKHLASTYNRPGHEILGNMAWCTIGDGCLQEGVALEAIQLAGHLKLDNLAVLYDNNSVTCDGTLDVTCSEDVNQKMSACGWNVIDVFDGVSNVKDIVDAMFNARAQDQKPTFINVRTILAFGSCAKQGKAAGHGDPLGEDDVAGLKIRLGFDPHECFQVDAAIYAFFENCRARGEELESQFNHKLETYSHAFPNLFEELETRMKGEMPKDWRQYIPHKSTFPCHDIATRESAAAIVASLSKNINTFTVGTANLAHTVDFTWKGHIPFLPPTLQTSCGLSGNYTGRYVHFGVREHAMTSISNGMAAFNRGTILPMTSAFFMFYIHAAPAIRLGAIQGLQVVHLATHDSIAPGIDGPAHQPIEVAAFFRAMPNLLYIRPCDSEETCGAFNVALNALTTPTIISLSRHAVPQYPLYSNREGVEKGAYVFIENEDGEADVTLISTGSEMTYAVQALHKLSEDGLTARLVSFPCQRLFELQPAEYKESVMQYTKECPIVVIEAYSVNGWERYADAGFCMNSFGKSLPENQPIYSFFNFDATIIAAKVKEFVFECKSSGIRSLRGAFKELNGGPMGYGWNPQ